MSGKLYFWSVNLFLLPFLNLQEWSSRVLKAISFLSTSQNKQIYWTPKNTDAIAAKIKNTMTTTGKTDWEESRLLQKDWASLTSIQLVTRLSKIVWTLGIPLWSRAYKMVQPRRNKFRAKRNFQPYCKALRLSNSKEKRTNIRVRSLWTWTWNYTVRIYSLRWSQKEP